MWKTLSKPHFRYLLVSPPRRLLMFPVALFRSCCNKSHCILAGSRCPLAIFHMMASTCIKLVKGFALFRYLLSMMGNESAKKREKKRNRSAEKEEVLWVTSTGLTKLTGERHYGLVRGNSSRENAVAHYLPPFSPLWKREDCQ